jgi:hypothetical protein
MIHCWIDEVVVETRVQVHCAKVAIRQVSVMRLDHYVRFESVREVPGCHLWNNKRRHLCAYMQCGQRAPSKALATFTVDRKVGLNPLRPRESQP